jgi:acetate kinase
MSEAILTLNAGSSSIKFGLFDAALNRLMKGRIENIPLRPHLVVTDGNGKGLADKQLPGASHEDVLDGLLDWIEGNLGANQLVAAGHRIVHGGRDFTKPVALNPAVRQALAQLAPLAPLHQPYNLAAAAVLEKLRPGLLQVGCFDTAFHSTIDATRHRFGLPREMEDQGLRRYGFHGLSYEFIARRLLEITPSRAPGPIVMAHLGSGSSLCAMHDGQSVDTSMGLTPLDGLLMGTRCGALDPGAILYLLLEAGLRPKQVEDILYHRSGLLGVSGISDDMRVLLASTRREAAEAIDLYVFRIVREIGAMAASLGGLDGIVFAGGIGENAPLIRERVAAGLAWLGLSLDGAANQAGRAQISTAQSPVCAWVIPTDEEQVIARHTAPFLDCARSTTRAGPAPMLAP